LKLSPPDKSGEKRVGEGGERRRGEEKNKEERSGRGLLSVPTVPNMPLNQWT